MYCHNVPGVVFISLWQNKWVHTSPHPTDPPTTPLLAHCSSVFHSVLECLQKASIPEHSFPGLNPTSDYFILLSIGSLPYYSHWFGSTKQLDPWMGILDLFPFCFPMSLLNDILCFCSDLISGPTPSLVMKDFILTPHSRSLSPETRCSFKNERSLSTSFGHLLLMVGLPERLPFLMKGPPNAAVALRCSCMPSLFQKHSGRLYP